ncbi:MAG: aspartate aminotransferase family protein [Aureliella sp.]
MLQDPSAEDPNAAALARERRVLASVTQRTSDPAFGPVIVRGEHCRVWDAAGREYFDLTCGYSAANFGHAYPPLVRAAKEQLTRLTHLTGLPHPGRAALAERLIEHCGVSGRDKVIFNTSGARAVETAWKAVVSYRPGKIVSLTPAYHGRSLASSFLSDTPRVAGLEPVASLAVRRPADEFAYCAACPLGLTYPGCDIACERSLLEWLEQEASNISAVIAEPALGARGYIAPPAVYWRRVRELTDKHGILMIADEVQTGLGRAGGWLLSRMQGWSADLVVLGKSLGGGITPISAVVGRGEVLDALPTGSESETFAASPLGTAIALAVMDELEHGPWLQRASEIGRALEQALLASRPCRGEDYVAARVEVCGASATLEFINCLPDRAAAAAEARRVAERCVAAGLLIHYSGPFATRIVFLPALTISDEDLREISRRLYACL